jgi:hypothetical protein
MDTNARRRARFSRPLWVAALPLVALGWSLATPGFGQVPVMLPEIQVSIPPGYDYGIDIANSVAIGEDGHFIVTWSWLPDSVSGCLRRSYDRFGNPESLPLPVQSSTGGGWSSDVARDGSGRYVIVWEESDHNLWGRRFGSDGTPLGDDFQVNTSSKPSGFQRVASDPSGNFVVAWTAGGDVIARLFDSHGTPRGDEFRVNDFASGDQYVGGAAMAPDGHFVVAWGGDGMQGEGVFVRLFDSSGGPITGDLQVSTTLHNFSRPDVSIDAAGRVVVVWGESIVVGQLLDPTGTPSGPAFPISGAVYYGASPRVASNSTGNFLVAWESPGIAARLYDPSGASVGPEFEIASANGYSYSVGARASLADNGSFVVAWSRAQYDFQNSGYNTVARRSGARALGIWVPSGNGVLEPGESAIMGTAWANDSSADFALAGTASGFTGPPGATYTLDDGTADYGTIPGAQGWNCSDSGNCYGVTVSAPPVRPAPHWDARLQETLSIGVPKTWKIHIGESFPDVPTDNQFYSSIETALHNGVTAGCFGGGYCPGAAMTRAQMAVFLLKSKFGSAHVPPPCTGTVFTDVPCTGGLFDPWIEELSGLGITGGCGGTLYCPGDAVTREQMAAFLLKTRLGSTYVPPPCAGIFADVACTPGTGFPDWIEDLYNRQITGGCSASPLEYCPTHPNNRGQMAAFLVKTFGLVLYGG